MRQAQVVVIGGGATGTGVARDLALRGISVILVEKDGLASGTTGRCHGLLHSGARYAVEDPEAAAECIAENRVLKRIGNGCVEDVGGLFVALSEEDLAYLERLKGALSSVGVPYRELSAEEVLREEPSVSRRTAGGLGVPDAAVDPFQLVEANALDATRHGAVILAHHALVGFDVDRNGHISAVAVRAPDGTQERIACDVVVNASGSWSMKVLRLLGLTLELVQAKGALIVYNRRLTRHVINRCRWPGDGDIVVPADTVTVVGTTSVVVPDPESRSYSVTDSEVALLVREGGIMVPELGQARIIRAFAGVRPLANIPAPGAAVTAGGGRDVTRRHVLVDHGAYGGPPNIVTIIGGKLTTYRLMAEETADWVSERLHLETAATTANRPLPDVRPRSRRRSAAVAARPGVHDGLSGGAAEIAHGTGLICECERVDEEDLGRALREGDAVASIDDARRRLRTGMGPCQGTFCAPRVAARLYEAPAATGASKSTPESKGDGERAEGAELILDFLNGRLRGQRAVLWGEQLKQAAFARQLYSALHNLDDFAGRIARSGGDGVGLEARPGGEGGKGDAGSQR